MPSTCAAAILAHAAAAGDRECCGLLLGAAGSVAQAVPSENVAADPRRAFEIAPQLLFDVARSERSGGPALLGWYHSHPDGRAEPSARDAECAFEGGRIWVIAASGALKAWRADGTGGFTPVELRIAEVA